MHGQKPFTPELPESHFWLLSFRLELGLGRDSLAKCISGFFPRHVTSKPKDQRLMLPVLFAVRLDLVHMEVPPPSLPSFACDFEPAILAALAARSRGVRTIAGT
jgi:hypothetical protein